MTLGEIMDNEQMGLLASFSMRYLGGDLPGWFYAVYPSCQTVPLFKNEEEQLRPLGVQNPLVRIWHREVIKFNKPEIVKHLEPQQMVLSTAGAA